MAQYQVTGADANGRTKSIVVEADAVRSARTKAKAQGLTPFEVVLADAATLKKEEDSFSAKIKNPLGGISTYELANVTRQLATLIKSHVPVVESLGAMAEQIDDPKLKQVLNAVKQQVNEGRSLADGLGQFPKIFSNVYVNMVRAGESAGRLDAVLLRLAEFTESQDKLKRKVQGALTYPIIMVVVAFLVLGIVFTKVVPEITKIFVDQKKALPLPTEILIQLSQFFENYITVTAVAALLMAVMFERYIRTQVGRHWWHGRLLRWPIIGILTRNLAVARFSRTLGTLLKSGVPMLGALDITRNVVSNAIFEDTLKHTATQVSEGRSLSSSLRQTAQYPPIVIHMIGVGEKTGELESMLENIATNYEDLVESKLTTLTNLLSPIMIIVMAGLVGFIVAGVLLPIFEMNNFG
jgi:general secretion pathway protein F